ncbi:MAG: hypothetical protein JJ902_01840 [Roseibium sp.]|nr:hypothetical protein [Roseibium sp.]
MSAPISIGELIDKITILELKKEHIHEPAKRANVLHELTELQALWTTVKAFDGHETLLDELRSVNAALWDVEDRLRAFEATAAFGDAFIQDARSVYKLNDRRAAIKREINLRAGSDLVEEKSYAGATGPAATADGEAR